MRGPRKKSETFSNKWVDCPVAVDLGALPVEVEIVFPLRRSLPFFLFGLGWTLASFLLFLNVMDANPAVVIFGATLFACGFAILVRSLSYVGARLNIHFGEEDLTVKDSSLFRRGRQKTLAYKEMEGVVVRQIEEEMEDHTKYYQVIELLHSDHKSVIPLYMRSGHGTPGKGLPEDGVDEERLDEEVMAMQREVEQVLNDYAHTLSLPSFRARTIRTDSLDIVTDVPRLSSHSHSS